MITRLRSFSFPATPFLPLVRNESRHGRSRSRRSWTLLAAGLALAAPTSPGAEPKGNPGRGRALFQQNCAVCHSTQIGGNGQVVNGQGPGLAGIFGRRAATLADFSYTQALKDSGLVWDDSSLDRYLANPPATVPGTNMIVTVPNAADRRNIIAFLRGVKGPARTGSTGQAPAGKAAVAESGDWEHSKPGTQYHLRVSDLPKPFSTRSAGNSPQVADKPADAKPAAPAGFRVQLFAQGLSGPRLLRVAPNGDIFIAETRANRIRVLRAADGSATPSENQIFADDLDRPFGIAFYPQDGEPQWLYIANNNNIVRLPYRSGDLKARGQAEVVVPKLSDTTGGHTTRDIAFSKDGKRLFITVGSGSNYAESIGGKSGKELKAWEEQHGRGAAWGPEANRAVILVTDPEGRQPLKTFATGIRNGVGLAVHPTTGEVWVSTNERDGLGDDLVPDYVTHVREGGFYGWPWYYMGNIEEPRLKGARPDLAGEAIVPDVLIQAHSAALQIEFYTPPSSAVGAFPREYQGELFVALHGSWNRGKRTGYKVVRVHMENGKAKGSYEDFLTGFVASDRYVWGRPVGVTVARDGSLLVTEDGNDSIWRVSYDGGATAAR